MKTHAAPAASFHAHHVRMSPVSGHYSVRPGKHHATTRDKVRLTVLGAVLLFLLWQLVNHLTMMRLPMPLYHAASLFVEASLTLAVVVIIGRLIASRDEMLQRPQGFSPTTDHQTGIVACVNIHLHAVGVFMAQHNLRFQPQER